MEDNVRNDLAQGIDIAAFECKHSQKPGILSDISVRVVFLNAGFVYQGGKDLIFSGYRVELCLLRKGVVCYFPSVLCKDGQDYDTSMNFFREYEIKCIYAWYEVAFLQKEKELVVQVHLDYRPSSNQHIKKVQTYTYRIDLQELLVLKIPV